MKKLLSIILTLTIIITLSLSILPVSAKTINNDQSILYISNVFYDSTTGYYCISGISENDEMWIIDIIQTTENPEITNILKSLLIGKFIDVTYNDMDTSTIYDDEIINWKFI